MVDIKSLMELVIKKFEPIECEFWRDCGHVLVGTALKKYSGIKHDEFVRTSILPNIKGTVLKNELQSWMELKDARRKDKE